MATLLLATVTPAAIGAAPTLEQRVTVRPVSTSVPIQRIHSGLTAVDLSRPCREYAQPDRDRASAREDTGMIICGPTSGGRQSTNTPDPMPTPDAEPSPEFAFDFFAQNDDFVAEDTSSTVNALLLAFLSMAVYSEESTADNFHSELSAKLSPQGVFDITVFNDFGTGADVAVVSIPDAVIVAFRGTSSNGTDNPVADYSTNAAAAMIDESIGDSVGRVHEGYWEAVDSVYEDVLDVIESELQGTRKLWITGHSLGGASATVLAARLHYNEDVPVQGLVIYGSPRVGNDDFRDATTLPGAGGIALADVTQRWEMYGDPATRYPQNFKEWICHQRVLGKCVIPGLLTTEYVHIGTTNTIEYERTETGTVYTVDYDTGEIDHIVPPIIGLAGLGDIHMEYEDALQAELERVLSQNGDNDIAPFMP
ncbi:MAG: lipase family protein [Gammaproteobacteria bacterium]|nr:lipase family protein [Gammaproteobacteria bacterium]